MKRVGPPYEENCVYLNGDVGGLYCPEASPAKKQQEAQRRTGASGAGLTHPLRSAIGNTKGDEVNQSIGVLERVSTGQRAGNRSRMTADVPVKKDKL